jgi:hypothetical protein
MYLHTQPRMLGAMNKLTATLIAVAACAVMAVPATAAAAKPVRYAGKTTGGHKITFNLVKGGKRIRDLVTATPTQCLPIQGGGSPMSGMDLWNPAIEFPVNQANLEWKEENTTSGFYYNPLTKNYKFSTKKLRNGTIRGQLRQQFEFLIPKYPIGTFIIYSCLGTTKFTAKPA